MQRLILRSASVALMLLVALPLLGGSVVRADDDEGDTRSLNRLLDGDYAFTFSRTCIVRDLSGALIGTNTAALRGIRRYDGKGEGDVVDGRIIQISPPSGLGVGVFTCDITYQVNPDMTTREEVKCTTPTSTITGIVYEGQMSADLETILLTDTDDNVEDISTDGGGATRKCGRSGTIIKLAPVDDDD